MGVEVSKEERQFRLNPQSAWEVRNKEGISYEKKRCEEAAGIGSVPGKQHYLNSTIMVVLLRLRQEEERGACSRG